MILKPIFPALVALLAATPVLAAGTNVLVLPDRGPDNVLEVSLTGDRNGGAHDFAPRLAGLLEPGSLTQEGAGNALTLSVMGDDNVFAVEQIGSGNVASILIEGDFNQTLLSQGGTGNVASIAQIGTGNSLAVRQRGR